MAGSCDKTPVWEKWDSHEEASHFASLTVFLAVALVALTVISVVQGRDNDRIILNYAEVNTLMEVPLIYWYNFDCILIMNVSFAIIVSVS